MSFKLKMYLFTTSIVGALCLVLALSFYGFNKEVDSLISGYDTASRLTSESKRLTLEFFRTVQEFKNLAIRGHDEKQRTKYIERITKRRAAVNEYISEIIKDPIKDKEMINTINEYKKRYNSQVDIYLAAPKNLEGAFDHKVVDARAKGVDRPTRETVFEYGTMVVKAVSSLKKDNRTYATAILKRGIFVVVGIVLVIAICAFFFILKQSKFLNSVTEALMHTSSKLKKSAGDVSSASDNLSNVSAGQAAGVQETVTTLDEISSMVAKNSENSQYAKDITKSGVNLVNDGKDAVNQMMSAIKSISESNDRMEEQVANSNAEISSIKQVISEIGDKTKVINDIVFQTKLLSFNASVEAARAGEHGKGFAVVAEEVGNLAEMSGNAAKEITELLEARMDMVTKIVSENETTMSEIMTTSKSKIEDGLGQSTTCAQVFEKILENANKTYDIITEVSSATEEQSIGVQEITKAMNELDDVTQKNSGLAHDTKSYGESLTENESEMSATLYDLGEFINGNKAA